MLGGVKIEFWAFLLCHLVWAPLGLPCYRIGYLGLENAQTNLGPFKESLSYRKTLLNPNRKCHRRLCNCNRKKQKNTKQKKEQGIKDQNG